MKTLNEEISEVLKSSTSKQTKQIALIKLGLRPNDIKQLLGVIRVETKCKFNANLLTFGVEIECYNVIRERLIDEVSRRNISIESQRYNHQNNKVAYKIVSDASIIGDNANEVVSPILKGKKGLDSLKSVCDSLMAVDARVNKSTGLHIHFDASKISDTHFVQIFKNYQKLEYVIDSFMPVSRRCDNNTFCKSLTNQYLNVDTIDGVIRSLRSRYFKVNAESYLRHKTIEFRQHGGTTDYVKIANWINFLRKLVQYSFDSEIRECSSIAEIPFLTNQEKEYFTNRKNSLCA